jgi:hypothetical protein
MPRGQDIDCPGRDNSNKKRFGNSLDGNEKRVRAPNVQETGAAELQFYTGLNVDPQPADYEGEWLGLSLHFRHGILMLVVWFVRGRSGRAGKILGVGGGASHR